MGLKSWLQNFSKNEVLKDRKLSAQTLREMPEDILRIEMAAKKGNRGSGKNITAGLTGNATFFTPKTIKDWNNAVQSATDPERPNFQFLQELYENLKLDAHVQSVIETRVKRVLRSKYDLISQGGEVNEDAKKLLNAPWFESFVSDVVMTKFEGIKVLELFDVDEIGELIRCKDIPKGHLLPLRQEIAKEAGGENGTSYVGGLANYYVEVGEMEDLGLLSQIATYILAKKKAMGAFLDYLHKYGVPPIIINTANYDKERQTELLAMGVEMHNNHVMVIQGNETFTLGDVPTGGSTTLFFDFIKLMNSEISKAVLGQDGTTENKDGAGTYGSLKIMQGVADDRHESDKLFVQNVINKELLPRLPKINSFYSVLTGLIFDWDESSEMEQKDYVESAVRLTQAGYELDLDELSNRSGITVKGYRAPFGTAADPSLEDPKKKSPAKK
ncbi:MAG: DUF935 family protein [Flavobacteriaceae bacterium]|nr:DUF935 family protein [Flavobacteriaceae bacterium]